MKRTIISRSSIQPAPIHIAVILARLNLPAMEAVPNIANATHRYIAIGERGGRVLASRITSDTTPWCAAVTSINFSRNNNNGTGTGQSTFMQGSGILGYSVAPSFSNGNTTAFPGLLRILAEPQRSHNHAEWRIAGRLVHSRLQSAANHQCSIRGSRHVLLHHSSFRLNRRFDGLRRSVSRRPVAQVHELQLRH